MLLFKVIVTLVNASIVQTLFFVASPRVYPSGAAFSGLAAVAPMRNNAFDLIGDALREGLSEEFGIMEPNEIQNMSLPVAISGNNTFVMAQTGSGKTLSFLLPILHWLKKKNDDDITSTPPSSSSSSSSSLLPSAIVIGPTTELLDQHSRVASKLMPSVMDRILFRTPEEVLESSSSLNTDDEDLANIDIVAIDEVDAVLCGSEFNDITPETSIEILGRFPDRAQYILTTAHLTRAHTRIINRLFPGIQTIRQSDSSQRVLVPTLRQVFHYFSGDMPAKLDKLNDVLRKSKKQPTIIFCKDEHEVETVHGFLESSAEPGDAFVTEKLHAGLSSGARSGALSRFQTDGESCRMLVTHEIAARGLDCPSVRHVVLFDTPTDVTAFVHRAGRTARAGEEGVVTCLVQAGGNSGGFGPSGGSGGSFGQHKNLHALLDAPKLNFAKGKRQRDKG